jgi:hypothetical protein
MYQYFVGVSLLYCRLSVATCIGRLEVFLELNCELVMLSFLKRLNEIRRLMSREQYYMRIHIKTMHAACSANVKLVVATYDFARSTYDLARVLYATVKILCLACVF